MIPIMKSASIVLRFLVWVILAACDLAAAESLAEIAATKAQSHLDAGKPEAALPVLDEALTGKPDSLDLNLLRAIALERVGRLDDAVAAVEGLVRKHPYSHRALGYFGSLLNRMGQSARAVALLGENAESELLADSHLLAPFGEACLRTGQMVRAQRALLRAIEAEAAGGKAEGMAGRFTAAARRQDATLFRGERTLLIVAYARQDNDEAIEVTKKLHAAGDAAFRKQLQNNLTGLLEKETNVVSRSVLALLKGEPTPTEEPKAAAARRMRVLMGQVMATVGCAETNLVAVARKRSQLSKTVQTENGQEDDDQKVLRVTMKADVDSGLTLRPKNVDEQTSTAAVAAVALEIQRQRPASERRERHLRFHVETCSYTFDVAADESDDFKLARTAKDEEEPTEIEFDLDGLPEHFPTAF